MFCISYFDFCLLYQCIWAAIVNKTFLQLLEEVNLRQCYEGVLWDFFETVVASAATAFQVNVLEETVSATERISSTSLTSSPSSMAAFENMLLSSVAGKSISEVCPYT